MNTDSNTLPIKSLDAAGIEKLIASYRQPKFRAKQIIEWLYSHGVSSYEEMTNLPKSLRQQLNQNNPLYTPEVVDKQVSHDGTRKYLLLFHDGSLVETVGIPSRDNRLTVCFSTQVGCPMGCVFCATGYEGFKRNLSVGEIIDQIFVVQNDMDKRVTNLVAMGQGEPFLNFDSVFGALEIVNSPQGLNIASRKITISTCGIIDGINKLAKRSEQYTLAVSLHAARQHVRDRIMPHAASNNLQRLKRALMDYIGASNRRVTLEYTLIKGMNDSEADLKALLDFIDGLLCHINLIPLNAVSSSPYQPSGEETLNRWEEVIHHRGIEATIRHSKGSDILGACGQLKNSRKHQ